MEEDYFFCATNFSLLFYQLYKIARVRVKSTIFFFFTEEFKDINVKVSRNDSAFNKIILLLLNFLLIQCSSVTSCRGILNCIIVRTYESETSKVYK